MAAMFSSYNLAMDVMENTVFEEPTIKKGVRSSLPQETRECLTQIGHYVLDSVINNKAFDASEAGFYDLLMSEHEKSVVATKLAPFADYLPSSIIHWYFSSPDKNYQTKRKNYIVAIVGLTWALTDLASKHKEIFESGSFTIIDPDNRIGEFLLGYVKLTTGCSNPKTLPFALTPGNYAYRRDPKMYGSSHHLDHCPDSQFGIDVRFESSESVLGLLPFDKTHILFSPKLDIGKQLEPLIFVKLEDIGMGSIYAMVGHTFKLGNSKVNGKKDSRKEKDIYPSIREAFRELQALGGLDGKFKTIRSMYLSAIELSKNTIIKVADVAQEAAKDSLLLVPSSSATNNNDLVAISILGSKDLNFQHDKLKAKAGHFLELIDSFYPNGNNHLRVGNEVILDLQSKKVSK
jgi:hypothetical protein